MAHIDGKWRRARMETVHMNKFNAGDRVLFTLIRQSSLDTWKEVDVRIYGTVTECFNEHKGYYRIKPHNHCDLNLVQGKRGIIRCDGTLSCYETELEAVAKSTREFSVGDRVYFNPSRKDCEGFATIKEVILEEKGSYKIIPEDWTKMGDMEPYAGTNYLFAYNDDHDTDLTPVEYAKGIWTKTVNTELCDKRREEYKKYEEKMKKENHMDPKLMAAATLDTTKNDKRIKASARYSRATFWGAVLLTSGAGQYLWGKAPVALHAFGEFLVNLSGK
jgi:hypothetical protein